MRHSQIPMKRLVGRYRSTKRESRLDKAKQRINHLADLLRLPAATRTSIGVRNQAMEIFRKAFEAGLLPGRSAEEIIAASMLLACRRCNYPKTAQEIVELSGVTRNSLAKSVKLLARELNLKTSWDDPALYVPKIAQAAGISPLTENHAVMILRDADRRRRSIPMEHKKRKSLAAGALLLACEERGEKMSQLKLSKVAGISDDAIHRSYVLLKTGLSRPV